MSYIFDHGYARSVNILKKKLSESIIDFKIINKSKDSTAIEISYPCINQFIESLSELELQRFGFESGFYRYVKNDGNYSNTFNSTRKAYSFSKVKDLSIWREFEDEFSSLKDNIREFLINNKNNIEDLGTEYKKYIENNIETIY